MWCLDKALMDFVREAHQQLDTLTSVLEEAKRFGAKSKALQFAEVASSAAVAQKIVPPGVVSGLYGETASSSGFEIHVEPPQLETRDVQDQLDAVMEIEEAKRVISIWFCCGGGFAAVGLSLLFSVAGVLLISSLLGPLLSFVQGKLPQKHFSCRRSLRPRRKS
jgi:hypothetical protein